MKTKSNPLFGACIWAVLVSFGLGLSNLNAAQHSKEEIAECEEALEAAIEQARAERDGALLGSHDDQEFVRIRSNFQIRVQEMRKNFVKECLDEKDPFKVADEKFARALIDFTHIGRNDEIGGQALTLLEAKPQVLQKAVDEMVREIVKDRSFDDAGQFAIFEMYVKGKPETVSLGDFLSSGARGRQISSEMPGMNREVMLTNIVLFSGGALKVYLGRHPEVLKELTEQKQKRLEYFGLVARKRAPLYAGAIQKNLGVPVTVDPHFAKAMALLPAAPIGRGTATPNATLPKQLVEALKGTPESWEKNQVVTELRHELYQRYDMKGDVDFVRLVSEAAMVDNEAAQKAGGPINPFVARRLVDGWMLEAGQLANKNRPEMESLKEKITQTLRAVVGGEDEMAARVAGLEAGFLNRTFNETLQATTGLDVVKASGIKTRARAEPKEGSRRQREESAPVVLSPWQIATNAYAQPESALKILNDSIGSLPETNTRRQAVRDMLTRTPQNKRDYGAEMFMLVPKTDRPAMAKYLMGTNVAADAALIAQGVKSGLDAVSACSAIKISRGMTHGDLWERRTEAGVYYNGVFREDSAPMLDPNDKKMIQAPEPRKKR